VNTKRAIEVLQSPASGFPNAFSATEHLEANALGAAALEREEKLRALIHHWKMLGELRFDEPIDAIEAILDGRAP